MFSRLLGIGIATLALTGIAPSVQAESPPGPRLAFFEYMRPPGIALITTSDAGLEELTRLAGGSIHARPLPYPPSSLGWAPDGSLLAFSGIPGPMSKPPDPRKRRIYVVGTDGSGVRAIPGTQGGFDPVFSPDGKSIAYARTLNRPRSSRWPPWRSTAVWQVGLAGGDPTPLTRWANGVVNLPSSFSPDGSVLGVTHRDELRDRANAVAVRLDGNGSYPLAESASWPKYSPDGSRIAFLGIRRIGATSCCELGDGFSVDLYSMKADGSSRVRLTDTPAKAERPASWDPSGERLVYTTKEALTAAAPGNPQVTMMEINADGSCPSRIAMSLARGERMLRYQLSPTWQPGPGRGAGRIAC
jgi:Tol biopolymer transport system component